MASGPGIGARADQISRPRFATFARIGHFLAVAASLILLVGACSLFAFRAMYGDKVLPSISVGDVPVGGMTRAEAQSAVDARANALLTGTMAFNYQGKTWSTTLQDLGVTADTTASVDNAFDIGRESGAKDRLSSAYSVASSDKVVPLSLTINSSAVKTWADQISVDIDQVPQDAQIVIADGEVSVVPEVDGVVVDKTALMSIIWGSISSMTPFRGALPVVNQAAKIRSGDVQPQVAYIQAALSDPVKVSYKSKHWTLTPKDLGQFFMISPSSTKPGYDVSIDDAALGQWIFQMIGDRVNREPVNAQIQWNANKNQVEAYSDSSKGIRIQSAPTADNVIKSMNGDHSAVEVTVKGIKPEIDSDDLGALHIDEQLAVGTSSFYGSQEQRATN